MTALCDSCSAEMGRALSVKQPWAALLVFGHKTIEIRRWRTRYRGEVLIHAARVPDRRREAWALVPNEIYAAAQMGGGIIGVGLLSDCLAYETRDSFAADERRHRNDPGWFREPPVYGFVLTQVRRLPFRPYPGSVRFFSVHGPLPLGKRAGRRWRSRGWHATGLFDNCPEITNGWIAR
jgi:hypothetical protein